MNLVQFREVHSAYMKLRPKSFLLIPPDPPASFEQVRSIECELGLKLPAKYLDFLKEFGGGIFGFTNIFSACPESSYYLPERSAEAKKYLPFNLLPFSDDGAGGMYVMKKDNDKFGEHVFYWSTDGGITDTEFEDIFEFVARYAYRAA